MRRNRFAVLIAVGALGGAFGVAASQAVAAPPGNSSCVATLVHELGPPGPAGGDLVSWVAHQPKNYCFLPTS